jgi:hypothetical protein
MFRPALDRIASLTEEQFEELYGVLGALKVHLKPDVIKKSVTSAASSSLPDLPDLVQTLINLSITRFRAEMPLDDFVAGISRSLKLAADAEKRESFEKRLKSLLNINALVLSARAFDIQHEYEKVFRAARIITDIRPVLNLSGTEAMGAMIVHNLSVTYFEDGEYKEVVFALDDADISAIRKIIERAEIKSKTLEKLIEKSGIEYFDSK